MALGIGLARGRLRPIGTKAGTGHPGGSEPAFNESGPHAGEGVGPFGGLDWGRGRMIVPGAA